MIHGKAHRYQGLRFLALGYVATYRRTESVLFLSDFSGLGGRQSLSLAIIKHPLWQAVERMTLSFSFKQDELPSIALPSPRARLEMDRMEYADLVLFCLPLSSRPSANWNISPITLRFASHDVYVLVLGHSFTQTQRCPRGATDVTISPTRPNRQQVIQVHSTYTTTQTS